MKKYVLIVLLILFILLPCCKRNTDNEFSVVSMCDITKIPDIELFSDTEYESYEYHFPPIESAAYIHDGKKEDISPNDKRLIRLLNFIAYSDNKMLSTWRQGYVESDEINNYLSSDEPMLEVKFSIKSNSKNRTMEKAIKMIVCGDSYLLFIEPPEWYDNSEIAERYWPYGTIASYSNPESKIEEILSYNGWGNEYWIDVLAYSGFIE